MLKKDTLAFYLRLLIVICASIGLVTMIFPNKWYELHYYTTLSNGVVLFFFVYLLYIMFTKNKFAFNDPTLLRIKGGITICITLTFIVYMVLLAPVADPKDFYTLHNYTLHYIVPILCIIDWLIIDRKHCYKKLDPIHWTVLPIIYMIVTLIKGIIFNIPIPDQKHSPFPYFFIDINQQGWMGFMRYFIIILSAYILIGYIMLLIKGIDKKSKSN